MSELYILNIDHKKQQLNLNFSDQIWNCFRLQIVILMFFCWFGGIWRERGCIWGEAYCGAIGVLVFDRSISVGRHVCGVDDRVGGQRGN
jgi:hypothetical protein